MVLLVTLAMTHFVYGHVADGSLAHAGTDAVQYQRMSQAAPGLACDVNSPYVYRLAGPYIMGILPGDLYTNYLVATFLAGMSLAALMYFFLMAMGSSPIVATAAVLTMIFNKYCFGDLNWNHYRLNDLIGLIQIIGLYWCMIRRRWIGLGIIFVAAVFTREIAVVIVPVSFIYLLETGTFKRDWKGWLVSLVPGAICFLAIRAYVPHAGGAGLLAALSGHADKLTSPGRLYALFVNAYAPLVIVPVVFYRDTWDFCRRRPHAVVFLLVVFVSSLFGSNDERLLAPASIIVFSFLATVLGKRCNGRAWILVLLALMVFPTSLDYKNWIHLLPSIEVMYRISWGSMAAIGILLITSCRKTGRLIL